MSTTSHGNEDVAIFADFALPKGFPKVADALPLCRSLARATRI